MRSRGLPAPLDDEGLSVRLYRGLLYAYPGVFRRAYEEQLVGLFADQLRDAGPDRAALAGVWLRSLADLASSAISEHLRKEKRVATSLSAFEPTRAMRLAGVLGLAGGIVLLWAWLAWNPFGDRGLNTLRLLLFWSGGIAVALAFHRRQAAAAPRLALVATGAVLLASVANVAWLLLARTSLAPSGSGFGMIGFALGLAGWLAAAAYGASILVNRSASAGMSRALATATRLAAGSLVVGGLLAPVGMDGLGLTSSQAYGGSFVTLAAVGVGLTGLGWLLLGGVLVFAGARRPPAR